MDRRWVVNASPLIALGKIGRLPLLLELSKELVIPKGVAREVADGPEDDPAREAVSRIVTGRIVEVVAIPEMVAAWDLGRGESEVLSFALGRPDFEAIIDDRAARNCAKALSVPLRGTMGILLLAYKQSLLPDLGAALDQLEEAGMHISPALAKHILQKAKEA